MTESPENKGGLGGFLDRQLEAGRVRAWRLAFFLILLAIALLNLLVPNHHPHFGVDRYPFFWVAFGLVVGVALVFLVKKIVQPLIKRQEDHYGDV
jgi:TRAP-type C4-dicarboxylate transport system permease small subunit